MGVRAVTGGSFRGGDASSIFQAGHQSTVLLSLFTVFPRELWGTFADIAWEEEQGGERVRGPGSQAAQAESPPGMEGRPQCVCRYVFMFIY